MRKVFREVSSLVIYNPKLNKILVQDRTGISKYGEEVSFFGGGLDEGETPLQAARRESVEELGQEFTEYNYIDTFIHDMNGQDYIRHLYLVTTDSEGFSDFEGSGAIWLAINELKKKRFTTNIEEEIHAIAQLLSKII